jgi:hypothetical protein
MSRRRRRRRRGGRGERRRRRGRGGEEAEGGEGGGGFCTPKGDEKCPIVNLKDLYTPWSKDPHTWQYLGIASLFCMILTSL